MSSDAAHDPNHAEALAGAEWRRKVLERLVVMGMTVAEEMEQRAVQGPEPRYCPGKAFAAASRAVRLTLVLHATTETDILAMRKGIFPLPAPAPKGAAGAFVFRAEPACPSGTADPAPSPGRVRRLVHDAVREAIDREIGDAETARETREALHERLIEGENFDAFLALPFANCVNAIRADLGLKPDWSLSSGMAGFARPQRPGERPHAEGWLRDLETVGPLEAEPLEPGARQLE